jgi:hypothetical protein
MLNKPGCIALRRIDYGSYYSHYAQFLKRHFLEKLLGHFDCKVKGQANSIVTLLATVLDKRHCPELDPRLRPTGALRANEPDALVRIYRRALRCSENLVRKPGRGL